jgi:hypothetical protein
MAELSSVVLEPRQAAFLGWLMDPRSTARPEAENPVLFKGSLADYSRVKRIGVSTLEAWKHETRFRQAWDEAIQRISGGPERLQAFLMELTDIAVGRDGQARTADRIAAIKLHLEVVGRHSPRQVVEIRDPRLDRAADDDLLERARRHVARIEQAATVIPLREGDLTDAGGVG